MAYLNRHYGINDSIFVYDQEFRYKTTASTAVICRCFVKLNRISACIEHINY